MIKHTNTILGGDDIFIWSPKIQLIPKVPHVKSCQLLKAQTIFHEITNKQVFKGFWDF